MAAPSPHRFAVAVDDTLFSRIALEHAIKHTGKRDILRVIHAVHMTYTVNEPTGEKIFRTNNEESERVFSNYRPICERYNKKCEFASVPYFGSSTEIANAICREATENLAEGIFIGSRGNRGLTKLLLGTVSEQILQNCNVNSTTIVRPPLNP